MRDQLMRVGLAGLLFVTFIAVPSQAAMLSPIATSGYDQDVVVEAGLSVGAPATVGEHGSRQFYEQGLSTQTGSHKPGLTQSVAGFASTAVPGNTIDFDFHPFEENNILKLDTSQPATKTLTLDSPARYTTLAVVLSGGSLATTEVANVQYTVYFVGGSTQTGTVNVGDWGTAPVPPGTETLVNVGRINMSSGGAATNWNNQVPESDTTANRWSIEVSQFATNSVRRIVSVDFGPITLNGRPAGLNSGDDVSVFGLSGEIVPEPASIVLALAGLLLAHGCMPRRRWDSDHLVCVDKSVAR